MKRLALNKTQIVTICIVAMTAVLIIFTAFVLSGNKDKDVFKPTDSPSVKASPVLDKTTSDNANTINTKPSNKTTGQPEKTNENTYGEPSSVIEPPNKLATPAIDTQTTDAKDKSKSTEKPASKDKPSTKPANSSKLIPDSQNPFINAPPTKVDEQKGSDFYQEGRVPGKGDKF